ncbi:phage terminase small subunit [Clostridium botulinum]|uniref:Phage terminase small subunit n=1 Tax=Clostridium botulinum (strain Hall / ATCC 3502 / NCTC 13319 / Type A) TaxID=441771 RepID=A5I4C7_CLOBH|nr:terminase small subunit [Clostridium botulinum]NFL68459.1 phage terminase small subunit [Clostridium botulinum]NFQ52990.1 phage terminase small subunit [Clostridium botulinum]NFT45896.1 phage terminase small subunit [Clostridium botulinum]QGT41835.1 hypothetical protein GJ703_00012 [Clostridium botulinum]CAL83899.1 phage terminase small subunit [Clostridium botulinum A str. ATCC 3502]
MESIRGPDIKKQAEKYYISGMKYKDIASKYNVSINTVKSWKQRYKWNRKSMHTKKKVCTQKQNKEKSVQEPMQQEEKEVLNNSELTDKQRLFCSYYIKYRNKTKAYMKAYQCSWENANAHAYELWENVGVRNEIDKQLKEIRDNIKIDIQDLIQLNIDIAFADMKDYVTFGRKEIEIDKDEENNPVMVKVNYVDFKNSNEVDGTLISEVKQGKDGVSIKLQDKIKAIDFLRKHIEFLDEDTKHKLDIENKKLQNEKLKVDIEKVNGNKNINSKAVQIVDDIDD